ncbi:MAG: hypothetical protein CL666_14700 [Balneola sp.]|nr:hypothetical protein [Balneola sp.]|tara:strand:+ start:7969 stop:8268 length:300 start_codon:yes stop_codon:yes gene_type:complete
MTDAIVTKAFTIIGIVTAWIFAQAEQFGGIIDTAFDQMFSLGLLLIVLIVLFKEYKGTKADNAELDEKFQTLLQENIETRRDFRDSIDALTQVISKMNE